MVQVGPTTAHASDRFYHWPCPAVLSGTQNKWMMASWRLPLKSQRKPWKIKHMWQNPCRQFLHGQNLELCSESPKGRPRKLEMPEMCTIELAPERGCVDFCQTGMQKSPPSTYSPYHATLLVDMELQDLMFVLLGFDLAVVIFLLGLFYPLGVEMFFHATTFTLSPLPPPLALFVVLRIKPRALCMLDKYSSTKLYL